MYLYFQPYIHMYWLYFFLFFSFLFFSFLFFSFSFLFFSFLFFSFFFCHKYGPLWVLNAGQDTDNCSYLSGTSLPYKMYVILYSCDMLLSCNNNMYHGLLFLRYAIWVLTASKYFKSLWWVLMFMGNEVQVVWACMPSVIYKLAFHIYSAHV